MPYNNVPKDQWGKMDSCVDDVMAHDKLSKQSAIAICYTSIVKHEAIPLYHGGRVVEGVVVAKAETKVPVDKLILCKITKGGREVESTVRDTLSDARNWFVNHGIDEMAVRVAPDGSYCCELGD